MKRLLPLALVAALALSQPLLAQESLPTPIDTAKRDAPSADTPPPVTPSAADTTRPDMPAVLPALDTPSVRTVEPPPVEQRSVPDSPTSAPMVPDSIRLNKDGYLWSYFRVGAYAGYAWNSHDTRATVFTGGGECGAFNNGQGNGPAVGLFFEIPVVEDWLDGVLAVNFLQRGGTFGEVFTGGLPVLDPGTNTYVELQRRHRYAADLGFVFAELGARMTPFSEYPAYVRLGGGIGVTASPATHHQTEELISPEGVLYPETNTRIRDVSNGTIKDVGPHIAVSAAVGYPFPLSKRMSAAPEVAYYYPLNDITPNYRWRVTSLQAGLALRWSFGKQYEAPPPEPPPVVVTPVEPAPPSVALSAAVPGKIEIVETVVTETFPVLPYVFFDSASAQITPRYRRLPHGDTASFNERSLPHRSLDAYYEMLNIVGSRMASTPGMKVTVNGTTDGREAGSGSAATSLARARAEAVKEYLVSSWGINPKQIAVTTSTQPTFPSSMEYAEGAEENRRVEIQSGTAAVLRPILFERFNEHAIAPKEIPFHVAAESASGIASWQLSVSAGTDVVWERSGSGTPPPDLTMSLDQDMAARLARQLSGESTVRCELRVTDNNGKTARSVYEQPANKMLNPFEVSRLSLIVFDFDKATITESNQRMISAFVSKSMQPTSTASIVGSTDRLGELEHNEELSKARAEAVRDLVVKEEPKANITSVEGVGPSRLLYDNATPEGRYYCRTVTVEVKTPIGDTKP